MVVDISTKFSRQGIYIKSYGGGRGDPPHRSEPPLRILTGTYNKRSKIGRSGFFLPLNIV